ncbi:MAG TPA: branched-chain amino acid ABC transporter permease [Amycolatopsis sp.]|nr:branched-chain amino acid ABC transporter permease [Amycolatopsis sp.]
MGAFLQVLINGTGKGAVFALLALGFVIIYKATQVVNFAHGSLALFGGYVVAVLKPAVGWWAAALAGIAAAALLALVVERLLLARARFATDTGLAILTIGVDVVLLTEIARRLGTEAPPFLGDPYDVRPIVLGGVTIGRAQAVALGVAVLLIVVFFLAFRFSSWGIAMRAQSENREAAALAGIRIARVRASAWAVGGALAGISVLFLATQDFSGGGLSATTHGIALAAFPAAIIGGLTSPGGAVVGGFVVGLTEAFTAQYVSLDFAKVAVYLVMLVVLVFRPSGLFGKVVQSRV